MTSSGFEKQVNNRLVPVLQVLINTSHIALVHALTSSVPEATVMSKRQKDACTVTRVFLKMMTSERSD